MPFDPLNINEAAPRGEEAKRALRQRLVQMNPAALQARLARQVANRSHDRFKMADVDERDFDNPMVQRVLDTTSGTTGNVLPRVDLEQTVAALFLQKFPYLDRIQKAPANGVVHTWNAETATGTLTDGQMTLSGELVATTDDTSTYKQFAIANISIIDEQRGISIKEQAAVAQSGMSYDPEAREINSGVTRMRSLFQRLILAGNFSDSGGLSTNESGAYSAKFFDGLRAIVGGTTATYQTSAVANAVQVDADSSSNGGPFTISQAVNYALAQIFDKGGEPSLTVMSSIAKQRLMSEQEGKQRTEKSELIPGVKVDTIATVAGDLPILMVPGAANALGSYLRTSDAVSVQDIYLLDEQHLILRWLFSPDITVLEIPTGVDGKLSRRFLMFAMYGLQCRDMGIFQGKVRLPN